MSKQRTWQSIIFSDTGILVMLALFRFLPLFINNGQTGWHCDELEMLDWRAAHPGAPLAGEPLSVGRGGTFVAHRAAQLDLAGAARFHLPGFRAQAAAPVLARALEAQSLVQVRLLSILERHIYVR